MTMMMIVIIISYTGSLHKNVYWKMMETKLPSRLQSEFCIFFS